MNSLADELLISTGMVTFTVAVHLVGLSVLIQLTRLHLTRFAWPVQVDRFLVPAGMVLGIFVIHGVEIWGYAALYDLAGAAQGLEEALYLSLGAYSTTGWVDVHLLPGWRVVLSLEAINGLLLVGWSTAFFFQNLTRIMVTEESHPLPEGAIAHDGPAARRKNVRP
ncbi:two pore domain potassium channel family protein [Phenylobacterium soli]|uniref:Two pore domain potassium channel family protein n=1 Tax=Phenylobacterium soli TaxID=2170551 RepID=A0A328AL47_9CAUL|nr:two pore domain potassium channel family protein [Phenylobacterium soli]RAK55115.1 two pore domain potassium channel family protein [Phenylobacterium soli]